MSKTSTLIKIVVAGLTIFGTYKLYKYVAKMEEERKAELEKHREEALKEVEGEIDQMEQWYDNMKNLTLNNEKLSPSDRAYAYKLYKDKFDKLMNAGSVAAIDEARKDLEEFMRILTETKDPETVGTLFKIYAEEEAKKEKLRAEKALLDADLEKNRAVVDMIEKLGTKVICNVVTK